MFRQVSRPEFAVVAQRVCPSEAEGFLEADTFFVDEEKDAVLSVYLWKPARIVWISGYAGRGLDPILRLKKWALVNGFDVIGWRMKNDHPLRAALVRWRRATKGCVGSDDSADYWVDLHQR